MEESAVGAPPRRPRMRRRILVDRVVAVLIVLVVIVVPIGFFVGGPALLTSYDRSHVVSLRCTIRTAEVHTTSSRSTRGVGSSSAEIVLGTSCGDFVDAHGVTAANGAALARRYEPGSVRSLRVGQGSIALRGLLGAFHLLPSVRN